MEFASTEAVKAEIWGQVGRTHPEVNIIIIRMLISLSIAMIFLSGCVAVPFPHDRRVTPLYYGNVSDADNGKPIKGVTVAVTSLWKNSETGEPFEAMTTTNETGYYEVVATEMSAWFFLWLGPLEGPCGGRVTFTHPEYETSEFQTFVFDGALADGVCTGKRHERNVSLKKSASKNSLNTDVQKTRAGQL